jgi:tetratricopeptide (TPR) repeat protein
MNEAPSLRAEAFDLWQEGRLAEAEQRYLQALSHADPRDYRMPDVHSQYARLLSQMHRDTEAVRQYERALQLELRNEPDEAHPAVVAARYVLGEHYLHMGEADSARRVVAPSLAAADKPLAWIVEAEALFLSGSAAEARAAADRAIALSADSGQRERIRARLAQVWEDGAG